MKRIHILSLIVMSIILTPWIKISNNLPELRPEWFIVLVGLAMFPVSASAARSRVFVWGGFVIATYMISMIFGALLLDINIDLRDLYTIISPVLFLLFYLVAASGTYSMPQYLSLVHVTLFALGLSAVITVIQFFNPDIVEPIVQLWADTERISMYSLARATGTMGNPNDQGFLMVTGLGLALFTLRQKVMPLVLRWVAVVVFFAAVFASGSRTGMVCVVAVTAIFLVLDLRIRLKTIISISITIAVIYWVFNSIMSEMLLFKGLTARVTSFQNLDTDNAWRDRVNAVLDVVPLIADSPLLGHGPAKTNIEKTNLKIDSTVDNEYILILYRFGLIGLIATIGFVWTLAMQRSRLQATGSPIFLSMRCFAIATVFAAALYAYTAGIFMSFRLLGLLIVLWTVAGRVSVGPQKKR